MRTHALVVASLLTGGLVLGTASAAAEDGKKATTTAKDKTNAATKEAREDWKESVLNSRIRIALLKSLKGADGLRVSVTVKGTTALLAGEVEDRASEKIAAEAAKSVEGVSAVTNNIKHNPAAPQQENLEANVKDAMLLSEVKLRLLQDLGEAGVGLHVTTTAGAVSLRGEMPNAAMRTRALEKVKGVSGVTRVEDLMTVKK